MRLADALPLAQNDEWLVGSRYLSVEPLSWLYASTEAGREEGRVVAARIRPKEIALAPT